MSRFKNDYAPNGKEVRRRQREEAGNKCVRCNHPYGGVHGTGRWTNCSPDCCHDDKATRIHEGIKQAEWRILTLHHFDGDKANDEWWNCMSLCQRCHLQVQTKVIPEIPYFFEHSEWMKPYVAGFYAFKYEGKKLTREEVAERMSELLAYEFRIEPAPN